ncbi:MAG: SRPBCC domain-containing protein [Vicingaceae bacterium]
MKLRSKAALQIAKPIEEVFEALVNPAKMTQYFISESNGSLENGKDLIWKFPEFEEEFPITEVNVEPYHLVSFVWDPETVVNITLKSLPNQSTLVRVREEEKELNEENLNWALSNSAGWANFLDCLKAYLEHGINLRKGAYDFMRKT